MPTIFLEIINTRWGKVPSPQQNRLLFKKAEGAQLDETNKLMAYLP